MYLQWNKNNSPSKLIICRWFYTAVILLLTCSSTFESATKCETCRELVKNFQEVVMMLLESNNVQFLFKIKYFVASLFFTHYLIVMITSNHGDTEDSLPKDTCSTVFM